MKFVNPINFGILLYICINLKSFLINIGRNNYTNLKNCINLINLLTINKILNRF